MDRDYGNVMDSLYDENSTEAVVLFNEKGEEIAFEKYAIIPYEGRDYFLLKPVRPIEGVGEDEIIIFVVAIDPVTGEERLDLVVDEKIIDGVYTIFERLVEEANAAEGQ